MKVISKYLLIGLILVLIFASCKESPFTSKVDIGISDSNFGSNHIYLDNGILKVGVNLNWGGAIDFISFNRGPNLVDRGIPDPGREIQVSLYDGNDYYRNNWTGKWGWNPVQAGDRKCNVSGHISSSKNGNLVYVKSRPLEWNGSGPSDIIVEQWVSLEYQKAIRITYKTTHIGSDSHGASWQEFPCVYLKSSLNIPYVVVYQGNAPWTNDDNIKKFQQTINTAERIFSSENWISMVGEDGNGVTLYSQTRDRVGFNLEGRRDYGSFPMNLIAAHTFFNPSSVYQTTVYLIFGHWQEARKIIYTINGLNYSIKTAENPNRFLPKEEYNQISKSKNSQNTHQKKKKRKARLK